MVTFAVTNIFHARPFKQLHLFDFAKFAFFSIDLFLPKIRISFTGVPSFWEGKDG